MNAFKIFVKKLSPEQTVQTCLITCYKTFWIVDVGTVCTACIVIFCYITCYNMLDVVEHVQECLMVFLTCYITFVMFERFALAFNMLYNILIDFLMF